MTDIREQLFEKLAVIEHERWSDWQKYMHDQCVRIQNGRLIMPSDLVKQWERQIATPYADLSEVEKESDRDQVKRYWPLLEKMLAVVEAAQDIYSSDVPFDSSKSTPVFWPPGVKLREALAALEGV